MDDETQVPERQKKEIINGTIISEGKNRILWRIMITHVLKGICYTDKFSQIFSKVKTEPDSYNISSRL